MQKKIKPTQILNLPWKYFCDWFGHKINEPIGFQKGWMINQLKLIFATICWVWFWNGIKTQLTEIHVHLIWWVKYKHYEFKEQCKAVPEKVTETHGSLITDLPHPTLGHYNFFV